jgi:hypothetical protein
MLSGFRGVARPLCVVWRLALARRCHARFGLLLELAFVSLTRHLHTSLCPPLTIVDAKAEIKISLHALLVWPLHARRDWEVNV